MLENVEHTQPSPIRHAIYVGDVAGKMFFEQSGVSVEPYGRDLTPDDVLIVGPGGGKVLAADALKIAAFTNSGGHVLALGLDSADAAFLPDKIETKKTEFITCVFPTPSMNSPLAGVGPA